MDGRWMDLIANVQILVVIWVTIILVFLDYISNSIIRMSCQNPTGRIQLDFIDFKICSKQEIFVKYGFSSYN